MASTFSPLLRIELIGAGEQAGAWNNTTNTNLGALIEEAISGVAAVSVGSSTSYTLTTANGATDEARSMVLNVTGTPGAAFNVICPTSDKVYIVKNGVATYAMTLKTSAGTGITIPSGRTMLLYCDGTNVVNGVDELPTGATVNGAVIATLTGTETLTNKTLTAPKFADGGFIADANGNEIVVLDTVTSAVNEITVANAAAGAGPSISATGSDSNIDLLLAPKGTGVVSVSGSVNVSGSQVISVTDNTNAALRVTQLGTGSAILVEDSTNPDATPFVVTADGNVGVGLTNPSVQLQVVGTASQNRLSLGSAAITNRQLFVRSNGTLAAPTIVASGDAVGSANFFGYDGAANIELANITATVDGTPGTNDMPGRLTFSTTADGAAAPTERFRIGNAGQLGIGGATYGTSGQVLTSGGASAAPSWATPSSLVRGTAIATTSGTSHDFSSIPSGVRVITLMLSGVSTNGAGNVVLQLGSSGTPLASGYLGNYAEWQNGGNAGLSTYSTSFQITGTSAAGTTRHGAVTLTNLSGNIWTMTFTVSRGDSTFIYMGSGSVTLSGTLDIIRLSSTSTFDAGSINILYQ